MEEFLQHIILTARTIQGIAPIFAEYALWISVAALVLYWTGEVLSRFSPYHDRYVSWIASAFSVQSSDVSPIPDAYLMGFETKHPANRARNPFGLAPKELSAHKSDYIVRGGNGAVFVSVYNWRGVKAVSDSGQAHAGFFRAVQTIKLRYLTGFRRRVIQYSVDDTVKRKSATLNTTLTAKLGSEAKVSSICLHKNRPGHLALRSAQRDIHGKLTAHIDIEQVEVGMLPSGNGGRISDDAWDDLKKWLTTQPSRINVRKSKAVYLLTTILLVALLNQTESATIGKFEVEIILESIQTLLGTPDPVEVIDPEVSDPT